MTDDEKYPYRGNLGGISCRLAKDPDSYQEVSLEVLLCLEDCGLVCDSNDGIWQYYFVKTGRTWDEGYFVKIKRDIVLSHLEKQDEMKKASRKEEDHDTKCEDDRI